MYNSPATPIGTGWKLASSTYIFVFAIGRPIVIAAESRTTGAAEDQIVVSVGPYTFQRAQPLASRRSARSRVIASPPQSIRRSGCPSQPDSRSIRQLAGVAC